MSIVCGTTIDGFGNQCYKENNIGQTETLLMTTPDFQFDTASDAVLEASYLQGIADKKVFPINDILEVEPTPIEDGVYVSPMGKENKRFNGRRANVYRVNYDVGRHKILKTWENKSWRFFKVEGLEGKVLGTSQDGIVIKGLDIQEFRVSTQKDGTSDTPAWTEIKIIEKNNEQWDKYPCILDDLQFSALDLYGVSKVTLTQVGSVAENAFTVLVTLEDATRKNGASSGADYSFLVEGLTTETNSFQLVTTATGAITNPTTVVVDAVITNKYVLTFAAAVATDTFKVIPQGDALLLHESAYITLT